MSKFEYRDTNSTITLQNLCRIIRNMIDPVIKLFNHSIFQCYFIFKIFLSDLSAKLVYLLPEAVIFRICANLFQANILELLLCPVQLILAELQRVLLLSQLQMQLAGRHSLHFEMLYQESILTIALFERKLKGCRGILEE